MGLRLLVQEPLKIVFRVHLSVFRTDANVGLRFKMFYLFIVVAKTFDLEEEDFHTVSGLIVESESEILRVDLFLKKNNYIRVTPVGP